MSAADVLRRGHVPGAGGSSGIGGAACAGSPA